MKIPHCTGCGEYPGEYVADEIEILRKRVAYLEGCAEADAKMIEKTADDAVRYKQRAEKAEARIAELEAHKDAGWDQQRYWSERYENLTVRLQKAEAALTEAHARLDAADRMVDAIEAAAISGLCERGWKELHKRVKAYRKET